MVIAPSFTLHSRFPPTRQLHVDNPEIKNVYCELNYFGAYQQKNWAPGAKDWAERSGKGLKFLTARHPYERLVIPNFFSISTDNSFSKVIGIYSSADL